MTSEFDPQLADNAPLILTRAKEPAPLKNRPSPDLKQEIKLAPARRFRSEEAARQSAPVRRFKRGLLPPDSDDDSDDSDDPPRPPANDKEEISSSEEEDETSSEVSVELSSEVDSNSGSEVRSKGLDSDGLYWDEGSF